MLLFKPCYPDENCAMPPRLRYLVYFLDFEMYSASRIRAVLPVIARHFVFLLST